MNIQHILTLSIDAIALCYSALMAANFVLGLLEEWDKFAPQKVAPQGICAATLAPIFEDTQKLQMSTTARLTIRELKKQASVAKIKNYSVLTKAQLIEALSA